MNAESSTRVAHAIIAIQEALKGLNGRETVDVLKAIGGMNNLVVQFPQQIAQRSATIRSSAQQKGVAGTGMAPPANKPNPVNSDPKVKAAKERLIANSKAIKIEANRLKVVRLPDDHDLILQRHLIETDLRSFRSHREGEIVA